MKNSGKLKKILKIVGILFLLLLVLLFAFAYRMGDSLDLALAKEAGTIIHQLVGQINKFYDECGRFPSETEGLDILLNPKPVCPNYSGDVLKKIPMDPWNHSAIKSVVWLFFGDGSLYRPNCSIVSQVVKIAVQDVGGRSIGPIGRHFREFAGFYALHAIYTKEEILENYINRVYVGEEQFGLPRGAHLYYAKSMGELSLDEIAGLIAILRSPGHYSPITQPEKHAQRKLQVLDILKQAGISE